MSATAASRGAPGRRGLGELAARVAENGLAAWGVALLLAVYASVASTYFLTGRNIADLLSASVVLGLVALGECLVMLCGHIDLSVGSLATLSAMLSAGVMGGRSPMVLPALAAVLAVGAGVGLLQGLLVTRLGLSSFIVTLGSYYALQGLAFAYSQTPVGGVPEWFADIPFLGVGPLPAYFVVLAVLFVLIGLLLGRTAVGRHLYAVGGDASVARMLGLRTGAITVGVFVVSALLAAVAGVVLTAKATVGTPTAGEGLELNAITAAVLGGVALTGGRGRLVGVAGGVALLTLIQNVFTLLHLSAYFHNLVLAVVILAAVTMFVRRDGD